MEITEEQRGAVKIIGLRGRLDATTCPSVEKRLLALLAQGEIRIAFDLSELSFISSAGLRLLLVVAKQVQTAGGRLAFAKLNENVREVFKVVGFTQLLSIYETLDEAATHCAG